MKSLLQIAGWNFCTGVGASAPNGSLFDSATDTGNGVDGPESVDQNNGWLHYYDPNANPLTVTWAMTCGTSAEFVWAGRVATFKSGGSIAASSSLASHSIEGTG